MFQPHLCSARVRVAAVPHPSRHTVRLTGGVSMDHRPVGTGEREVTGLGNTDPEGVDPSRDQHDPLGSSGNDIAAGQECIESYQLAVHDCRDDHPWCSSGPGAEPKELLEARQVGPRPRSPQLSWIRAVPRHQQMQPREHLARRLPPHRREVDCLGGRSQSALGERVVACGRSTGQQGGCLRSPHR